MKINWFSMAVCIALAALFPDLPLLAGRLFGYKSHLPMTTTIILAVASALYLWSYWVGNVSKGRWLASAWAAVSMIGLMCGLSAALGMSGVIPVDFYNFLRGIPAHVFQVAVAAFLIFYAADVQPIARPKISS